MPIRKQIIARITKVDAAKREVYGVAAEEAIDQDQEVFDYASSAPYFKAWSETFAKNTDGKSLGNLRAMHGNVAAGKLIQMDLLDAEKQIYIGAKVVDDDEWKKVEEGVYTGFSIGGEYVKKWKDDALKATRYTANPCEISIVDNPCMPGATFEYVKADGAKEMRKFTGTGQLAKSMYDVADLSYIVAALNSCRVYLAMEADYEGDGSQIPARLKAVVQDLASILKDLVVEETSELTNDANSGMLSASATAAIEKKKTETDMEPMNKEQVAELAKNIAESLQKTLSESITKSVTEAVNANVDAKLAEASKAQDAKISEVEKAAAASLEASKAILKSLTPAKLVKTGTAVEKGSDGTEGETEEQKALKIKADPLYVMKSIHAGGGAPLINTNA